MDPHPLADFAVVEKRIRALTTILRNMGHHRRPSENPKHIPSLLHNFANLITRDDISSPKEKKAMSVTGAIFHDGVNVRLQALIVTQNLYPSSPLSELKLQEVTKSQKSFKEIVNNRNGDVTLKEHISDVWTALASFEHDQDSANLSALCRFIVSRCSHKLFTQIFLDQKTWHVHVAQKLCHWTPKANELLETYWFDAPIWFGLISIPSDTLKGLTMRKQGPLDKQVTQLEFSSKTLQFWAWLLGHLILLLESGAAEAQRMEEEKNTLGFKEAVDRVSDHCLMLLRYIYWKASIVETLLTKTTLASTFGKLPCDLKVDSHSSYCCQTNCLNVDMYDSTESDDLLPEPCESDGHCVLRHLKAIVAWHMAVETLCSSRNSQVAHGKLVLGLLDVPHCGFEIASLDDIYEEYFKRYASNSEAHQAAVKSFMDTYLPQSFPGTIHAEATLMGLLSHFSASNHVHDIPLPNDHVMALGNLLEPATVNNAIGLNKKCCLCCLRFRSELLRVNGVSCKLPGSNGMIYPWSPPHVGVDLKVIIVLEDSLWRELHEVLQYYCPAYNF
ncbi:hypothetical protein F4604DRAFT_1569243 [Suillus subluteus]|nr:hypothetical protein F4604DRAFT_1569243 [Suillus subluteus]